MRPSLSTCWRALLSALLFCCAPVVRSADFPWDQATIKVERWPRGADSAQVSTAISVAPGLLATILVKPVATDSYRAVTAGDISLVKLIARDSDSGFSLLTVENGDKKSWPQVPLVADAPAIAPGSNLILQAPATVPARFAGRELLHRSRLLESPWMRVHLPTGSWAEGTPLTTSDGKLAGILAAEVPGVAEAARVLPASAVAHFVKMWTERQSLARAVLGLRLSPAAGIPRVEECVAALPAERAGLQPGDVLLRIGTVTVTDAAAAAEACFYLRVDEPVKVAILRGTETMDLTMTPVSATGSRQAERKGSPTD